MASENDAKASLESFVIMRIHRSQAKNATYNPRILSPAARRKLKAGIQKRGIMQPIVWNKRSGNIVGGHQRISIMDSLMKTQDYEITVAAVDLDEKAEIEANLLLNNAAAMGDFNLEKLEELVKIPDLDIEATGWDKADVYRLFGSDKALGELEPEKAEEVAQAIRETAKRHAEVTEAAQARDSNDFYLVLVFGSYAERQAFTERAGLEDNRYQSGQDITALCFEEDAAEGDDAEDEYEDDPKNDEGDAD